MTPTSTALAAPVPRPRLRLGLCCQFSEGGPRFRHATHRYVASLGRDARRRYLSNIARANAIALAHAVARCAELDIGAFRINSQILPLNTHPDSGYVLEDLDEADAIIASFRAAGALAQAAGVRFSFHPDQFVVLNSESERTVAASVRELDAQAVVADLVGADLLTLHAGGAVGGIPAALERLARGVDRLSPRAHALLGLENDDRSFAPADLLPFCEPRGIPVVYDVHHHRCHPDGLSVAAATAATAATWGEREPYAHISSPLGGWTVSNLRPHADLVDPGDLPAEWLTRRMTVDVEAKAKEVAVVALQIAARTQMAALPAGAAPGHVGGRPDAARRMRTGKQTRHPVR